MPNPNLKAKRMALLLDAFERCTEETGREILRHAIEHMVFPMWERQWPTAVTRDTEPCKQPKDIQEGTANHVRMIVRELEAGDSHEALMLAYDLLDQLVTGHLKVTCPR